MTKGAGKLMKSMEGEFNWLKLIGSIFLIFSGVYLPLVASETASSVVAVSAALSAAGGALLADAFSTPRRYVKSISPRLNSINRLLATITSQVSAIIVDEKKKSQDNHPINRLSETIPALRAIIADINDLTGEKFDPGVLNDTITSIGELITKIESGAIDATPEELTEILKDIQENLKQDGGKGFISESSCPYDGCDGRAPVELQPYPSTSRIVSCPICSKKYHAQRTSQGGVETKIWGASKRAA